MPAPTDPKPPEKSARAKSWMQIGSASLLVILAALYAFRPAMTTAITTWPAAVGMFLGIGIAMFARRPRRWLIFGWLAFGLIFVEEFRSLPRELLPAQNRDFRVITLNCAGGSALAAAEVKALQPDLVLLQESPSRPDLERLAQELFGDSTLVTSGPDAAILARGKLTPIPRPRRIGNFVAARWEPAPGQSIDVVSLRLAPPVLRFDLLNPAAWQKFSRSRDQRGEEMNQIQRQLQSLGAKPVIIGGDFNTPPDAGIQKNLLANMQDAFNVAGVGLGATCVNPYPSIVRIDQIWTTPRVECVRAWVATTQNSDHRMLVADYRWR